MTPSCVPFIDTQVALLDDHSTTWESYVVLLHPARLRGITTVFGAILVPGKVLSPV